MILLFTRKPLGKKKKKKDSGSNIFTYTSKQSIP